MARSVATFQAKSLAALETGVNAILAALTDPDINGAFLAALDQPRRVGVELSMVISTTDGGATLGTPFLLKTFQNPSLADLETAVQAFLTTNASYFVPAVRYVLLDTPGKAPMHIAWFLYNVTGGASANWVPL